MECHMVFGMATAPLKLRVVPWEQGVTEESKLLGGTA